VRTAAVVVHWRGRADTERCLSSLLAPGGPDRIVLVDNGSGESFDGRVEVLRLPRNAGFAAAANAGAREAVARGADLLLFLNNDAVLEPGALRLLEEALAADPRAAAAGPRILRDDGTGRPWFEGGSVSPAFGQVTHGTAAGATGFLTFCAVLVRREAWESVGPLDEEFFAYGEDADWSLRALGAGFRLLHLPGAGALHRVNGSLGSGSAPLLYLLARSRVLLARRHCGAAARGLLFWPWLLLVRGPHDFLKALLTRGLPAALAGVRGVLDGARGGAPRAFRAELGLDGAGGAR
jgi:GT2 family glycosyltransferase